MIRIISAICEQYTTGKCHHQIILLFWNRTEEDIIWRDQFQSLSTNQGSRWFSFFPILTKPPPSWNGMTGRPSKNLHTILPDIVQQTNGIKRRVLICGPTGFNKSVQE